MNSGFDLNCRVCTRLADFMDQVKLDNPGYHCRPVPPFGDAAGEVLVVGLAPGMHGANATGRPFTGDYAGVLLYETLHKYGFASKAKSLAIDDGLVLTGLRITNAVKCLPPGNKPLTDEIKTCNGFLQNELKAENQQIRVILALGTVAHQAVLRAFALKIKNYPFGHANEYPLPSGQILLDSYHCSRYNTNTRRLTEKMFHQVFARAREIIESH